MDSFAFISSNLHRESHIFDTNCDPQSDVILVGRLYLDQTSQKNRSAVALVDVCSSSFEQDM